MSNLTRKELYDEAREKTDPVLKNEDAFIKSFKDIALITSLISLCAYIDMYSYKINYYKVFNIPSSCVKVELNDYLPMLYILLGCAVYWVWYLVLLKSDIILKKKRISPLRVLYGYSIINWIFMSNSIGDLMPAIVRLLIPLVLSIAIELIVLFVKGVERPSIYETVGNKEKKHIMEEMVSNILISRYLVNSGLCIIILLYCISSLWGGVVARSTDCFQVFDYKDEQYAVIIDFEDAIIAQKASIDNKDIALDITQYLYLDKDGLEFSCHEFEKVVRSVKN